MCNYKRLLNITIYYNNEAKGEQRMKRRAFLASLCLILAIGSIILVMRSAAGSTTAQSILSSQGTIAPLTAKYIVQSDGLGGYSTINSLGQTVQYGIDAANLINNAFGNLTVGGEVLLNGNFTVASPIIPSSYSTLYINGTITLANFAPPPIPIIDVDNKTEVNIIGGRIEGNSANQYQDVYYTDIGIYITDGSTYCTVSDVYINDCMPYCMVVGNSWGNSLTAVSDVNVTNCVFNNGRDNCFSIDCSQGSTYPVTNVLVSNCQAMNGSDYGFDVYGTYASNITFSDCIAYSIVADRSDGGGNMSTGFGLEWGCHDITLTNCVTHGQAAGFAVVNGAHDITIINPTIYDLSGYYSNGSHPWPVGILVEPTSYNVEVDGGTISNVQQRAINVKGAGTTVNDVTISDVTFYDGIATGINMEDQGNNSVIQNCLISNCPSYGILIWAVNNTSIYDTVTASCGCGISEAGGADYTFISNSTNSNNGYTQTSWAAHSRLSGNIGWADYPVQQQG